MRGDTAEATSASAYLSTSQLNLCLKLQAPLTESYAPSLPRESYAAADDLSRTAAAESESDDLSGSTASAPYHINRNRLKAQLLSL